MTMKEIKGAPGYMMDVDSGRVYSYKGCERRERKTYVTPRGRIMLDIYCNGRRRAVGLYRLWYCVLHDIALDTMPGNLSVTCTPEGKPMLIDQTMRCEKALASRIANKTNYRTQFFDRKMTELQLMRGYYESGDMTAINEYVESIRDNMLVWYRKSNGCSLSLAENVFELAVNSLQGAMEKPGSRICDILLMVKNLMMTEHRRQRQERRDETEKEYEMLCHSAGVME